RVFCRSHRAKSWALLSCFGKLTKPPRQFGPLRLFLVLEKDESPLPFLRQDAIQPLREIGLRIIGTAQAQIPPVRRADDLVRRLLVGIRDAQAAVPCAEKLQNLILEPTLAAEF